MKQSSKRTLIEVYIPAGLTILTWVTVLILVKNTELHESIQALILIISTVAALFIFCHVGSYIHKKFFKK